MKNYFVIANLVAGPYAVYVQVYCLLTKQNANYGQHSLKMISIVSNIFDFQILYAFSSKAYDFKTSTFFCQLQDKTAEKHLKLNALLLLESNFIHDSVPQVTTKKYIYQ